jgi:hypothetical protein
MRRKNQLSTEFSFTLPRGLMDEQQRVHRQGVMRFATARDELFVQQHPGSQANSAYGFLVMLSEVIVRLGNLTNLKASQIETLTIRDIAYLREFYNRLNQQGNADIPTQCPHCQTEFAVELQLSGEL